MPTQENGLWIYKPLQKGVSKTRARDLFDFYSHELMKGWLEAQVADVRPTRRSESPNAWFKKESYALICDYIKNDLLVVFRDAAKVGSASHKLVEESTKNPFKLGLLAFGAKEFEMTRNNRHVFGNQMAYAWIHDVPHEFLNAFLAVSGGPAQIASKLKAGVAEPGFEHRFSKFRSRAISE